MNKPLISVLLPVYNAGKYLRDAIESILNQTYSEFDLLIINDGSTDNSEEVIFSYSDPRIRYIKNEKNSGLIYTLNKGLSLIDSEYIIRMDADDISMPQRFQKQLAWMQQNPNIIVCGSQINYFGEINKTSGFFVSPDILKAQLVFASGIAHPSVIIRNQDLKKNVLRYSNEFLHLEDHEFWLRLSKYGDLSNLDEVLLRYRVEGQNISMINWRTRSERLKGLYKEILIDLQIQPDEENFSLHLELAGNTRTIRAISGVYKHKQLLIKQNDLLKIYPAQAFRFILRSHWDKLFYKVADESFTNALKYWVSSSTFKFSQFRYLMVVHVNKMIKGGADAKKQ